MAGRLSTQTTNLLEDGELPSSIASSSSTQDSHKHHQPISNPDLKLVKDTNRSPPADSFPSLKSSLSNSSSKKQNLQPSSSAPPPLEQGVPPSKHKGTEKPPSFLQVVQTRPELNQVFSDLVFPIKQIQIHQGKPSITFTNQEKTELLAGLKFILIGKFTHGRPPMAAITKFFTGLNLKRKVNLSLMDKKHIFIECLCKADYYYIWLKLRWSILGFTMRIFKWEDGFSPSKESSIAPVWIRLANLPLYFFEVKTLFSIANVIGCPILIDPKNANRSDLGTARICIELDVAQPLVDSIWINLVDDSSKLLGGFWVHVSYDVVPAFCLECLHVGHGRDMCKRLKEEKLLDHSIPKVDSFIEETAGEMNCPADVEASNAVSVVKQQSTNGRPDAQPVVPATQTAAQNNAGRNAAEPVPECGNPTNPTVSAADTTSVAVLELRRSEEDHQQPSALAADPPVLQGVFSAADRTSAVLELVHVDTSGKEHQQPTEHSSKSQVIATQNKSPQVWQRVKGQNSMKMQTETDSFKSNNADSTSDKGNTLSTANRFSALITEPIPELNVAPFLNSSVEQVGLKDMDAHLATPAADSVSAVERNTPAPAEPEKASPGNAETDDTTTVEAALSAAHTKQTTQIITVTALHSEDAANIELSEIQEISAVQQGDWNTAPRQKERPLSEEERKAQKFATFTTERVTTRAAAKKLSLKPTPTKENSTKGWVASTFKAKDSDKIRHYTAQEKEEIMQRIIASAFEEAEEDDEQHKPFIPPKPATKDGHPAVIFKKSDLRRWVTKQRTRANKEKEQMCANGFPFDDKG